MSRSTGRSTGRSASRSTSGPVNGPVGGPVKAEHHTLRATLAEPFSSNTGLTTHVHQQVLVLHWEGLTGYGTALATRPGELDACLPLLTDASPLALARTLGRLHAAGIRPAVVAAVDMALHDLLGKRAGLPLHALLGLAGQPLAPTALSIGAGSDEELIRRGRALAHWPVLKLKLTPEDDGSRAGVLREVYDGRIWVDGNGSWTPERAVEVARELDRHGVELLEQPVPPGPADRLRYVHENAPLPVVADEDCTGPEDVLRLRGSVSAVNIKLTKCGGLRRAHETATLARRAGLKVMLGCKTESALGVTAMAQLAPLADHLDLDGHVDLTDDPFRGLRIDEGTLLMPDGPGLGVTATDTTDEES
ncbi:mandelate racemase/muconate lactonizing enzyme family protein [Streptomyces roseifaciens]|uniref:mandelate racemase/muconate lactonizing enzyme family protein n=1 Tax=Streptomyces roseifaciens TaxID=1488406 RepID=UPI000718112E|nr:enolase C-terminal domain-like protein [Streptomyces roseifaciens]